MEPEPGIESEESERRLKEAKQRGEEVGRKRGVSPERTGEQQEE